MSLGLKYAYALLVCGMVWLGAYGFGHAQRGRVPTSPPFSTAAEDGTEVAQGAGNHRIRPIFEPKYYRRYYKRLARYKGKAIPAKQRNDNRYTYLAPKSKRAKLRFNTPSFGKRVSYKNLTRYTRKMKAREDRYQEIIMNYRRRSRSQIPGVGRLGEPRQQLCLPQVRIQRPSRDLACMPKLVIKHHQHDKHACPTYGVKHKLASNYNVYCDPSLKITSNMQRVAKDIKYFFTNHRKYCKLNAVHSGIAVGQALLDTVEYRKYPYIPFVKATEKVYGAIVFDFIIKKRVIQYYRHNDRKPNKRKRQVRKYPGVKHIVVLVPRKPNFLVKLGLQRTFKKRKLSHKQSKLVVMRHIQDRVTKYVAARKENHPWELRPGNFSWQWKFLNITRMYPEERENIELIKMEVIAQDNIKSETRTAEGGDVPFFIISHPEREREQYILD